MPINRLIEQQHQDKIMKHVSITVNETAHWHALIGKAEYWAHNLLPYGVEDYLVRLFMRFEQQEIKNSCNIEDISDATSPEEKLRRLGDQCLLLCGFYPEASDEYGIALDEFISMGSDAYQKLAAREDDEDGLICNYLAINFGQIVELLSYIGNFTGEPTNKYPHKIIGTPVNTAMTFKQTGLTQFSSPISQRVLN